MICVHLERIVMQIHEALKHYPDCVQPVHTLEEVISKLSNFSETIDTQFMENSEKDLAGELGTYLVDAIIYGKVKASEDAIDLIPYEVFDNYALSRKCESDTDECVEDFIAHYKQS